MNFSDDRDLWLSSRNGTIPASDNLSSWGFVNPKQKSSLFEITICRKGTRANALVSVDYAPMLVYFDLEYWATYSDPQIKFTPLATQAFSFMHELRRRVENEMLSDNPSCDSLLFWAARTARNKNQQNSDASQLQNEGGYDKFPSKKEWAEHIFRKLPLIPRRVEIFLQESSAEHKTGKPDALSFAIEELGFKSLLPKLPFKPGKVIPEVLALGRKRGLSAATISQSSKRARDDTLKGLEGLKDMVNQYRGNQIPLNAEQVKWKAGFVTCLPWTRGICDEIWDKELVLCMANAPDAGDVYSVPEDWCLRLGSPGSDQPIYAHDSLVRDALGDNRCVLLTGYHLEGPTSMSADEMVAWRGSLNQKVVCMDAKLRIKEWSRGVSKPQIYQTVTLQQFLRKKMADECLNCLDLPGLNLSITQPSIISRISDNTKALTLTADIEAEFVRLSTLKMSHWNLLTHPGFVTYPHKDANGLCTWIYAHQGVKVWGILRPTYDAEKGSKEDVFKAHDAMVRPPGDLSWDNESEMYTIFLAAGDLLDFSIMPPGTWHVVYTPTPSYVSGGHFYTYETMHLTEFSRSFDHRPGGEFSTNANHDVLWILCRMAMSLHMLHGARDLYTKPLVALAKMILQHADYDPAGYSVPKPEGAELRDLDSAKRIMQNFIATLGKVDPGALDLKYGKDWALHGKKLDGKVKFQKAKISL